MNKRERIATQLITIVKADFYVSSLSLPLEFNKSHLLEATVIGNTSEWRCTLQVELKTIVDRGKAFANQKIKPTIGGT